MNSLIFYKKILITPIPTLTLETKQKISLIFICTQLNIKYTFLVSKHDTRKKFFFSSTIKQIERAINSEIFKQ